MVLTYIQESWGVVLLLYIVMESLTLQKLTKKTIMFINLLNKMSI